MQNQNDVFGESATKNVIRIISVLKAYYGDNAYYVRIKGVLLPQRTNKYVSVAHLNEALDFSNDC